MVTNNADIFIVIGGAEAIGNFMVPYSSLVPENWSPRDHEIDPEDKKPTLERRI